MQTERRYKKAFTYCLTHETDIEVIYMRMPRHFVFKLSEEVNVCVCLFGCSVVSVSVCVCVHPFFGVF